MPTFVVQIFVATVVVALSIAVFRHRGWPVLKMAVVLGLVGPLPGFLSVFIGGAGLTGATAAFGALGILAPYLAFAVPTFGSYCFVVGLLGGAFIRRYTVPPAPGWSRPAAIIAVAALAAVPVVLLFRDSELATAAIISSVCCAIGILAFSRRIFVPAE